MQGTVIKVTPVFTALVLIFIGCGQTITISRKHGAIEQLPGIPFYVKTAGCEHRTLWLQPVYTLTFKETITTSSEPIAEQQDHTRKRPQSTKPAQPVQAPEKKEKTEVITDVVLLSLNQYRDPAVFMLRNLLSAGGAEEPGPGEVEAIKKAWQTVRALMKSEPFAVDEAQLTGTDKDKVIQIANEVVPRVFVDYHIVYYYNTKKPMAGTSQASIKLANDGTMAEGSAQVETKTLATFFGLLPVSDVLTKVAAANLPVAPGAVESRSYKFELSTQTALFKHTHYVLQTDSRNNYLIPPCEAATSALTEGIYNVTVEDVSQSTKENDGSTVKANGAIKLPK